MRLCPEHVAGLVQIGALDKRETQNYTLERNLVLIPEKFFSHSDLKKISRNLPSVIVYYLKTQTKIILTTIYSKSDQTDIANKTIEEIIQTFEQ